MASNNLSILQKYQRIEKPVGQGTYGVVYKAICKKTQETVALKKIKLDAADEGIPATALREISILRSLSHRNIVKLTDVQHTLHPPRLYLVFEWLECDLHHYLEGYPNGLPASELQEFMYQILLGLDFCHIRGIFHRDLKPQNVLVTKDRKIKIADFGLARAFNIPFRTYTHEIVTLWYRAPEILLGEQKYGLPVDIWSVGTIFAELATGKPIFPGDCEIDELFQIFRVLGTPNNRIWPKVTNLKDYNDKFPNWKGRGIESKVTLEKCGLDLLKRMLVYSPGARISCKRALQHQYFEESV